jgi:hypothetical protein
MEGKLHQILKKTAIKQLESEGYNLYVEPNDSPLKRLCWNSYRPDILGMIYNYSIFSLVLVECETMPSARRIGNKILKLRKTLTLQKRLNEEHFFRYLLLIPPKSFNKINYPEIRSFWETWIVNLQGEIIYKIFKKEN